MKSVRKRLVLAALPKESRSLVELLIREAEGSGIGVSLVGGPVRDFLLSKQVRDVDLCIESGHLDGVFALVKTLNSVSTEVIGHARFGTVRIAVEGGVIDLAEARKETYERNGALPRVEPASLEEDLARRDFSVNALAIPLSRTAKEKRRSLIDPCSGYPDIKAGVLRTLHSRSFHDDPTRALRAARFASRFSWKLPSSTRSLLRKSLHDKSFDNVSGSRLRREFEKVFEESNPAEILRFLSRWHVLDALVPGLAVSGRGMAGMRKFGKIRKGPPWLLSKKASSWSVGMMLWLGNISSSLREETLKRMTVSGVRSRRIQEFPKLCELVAAQLNSNRGRGAADEILRTLSEDELLACYCSIAPGLQRRVLRYLTVDRRISLPVDGRDLLEIGLRKSEIGEALRSLRVLVLDGRIRSRDEALHYAKKFGSQA